MIKIGDLDTDGKPRKGHERVPCKFCHKDFMGFKIGRHRIVCKWNPKNVKKRKN